MTVRANSQSVLSGEERISKALQWLQLGDANRIVHQNMDKLVNASNNPSIALVSLAALCMSLELMIKGILTVEGTIFPYNHDPQRLFGKLSSESKIEIDKEVNK